MELKNRISNIKDFFVLFQMSNEASYALVDFPEKWVVPEEMADGKVSTSMDSNGYYFFTEPSEDPDIIFDAIEEVITYNENMMKKNQLFVEKINELKNIFENEELDKLSTMEFSFGKIKPIRKVEKKKETSVKVEKADIDTNTDGDIKDADVVEDNKKSSKIMEEAKNLVG